MNKVPECTFLNETDARKYCEDECNKRAYSGVIAISADTENPIRITFPDVFAPPRSYNLSGLFRRYEAYAYIDKDMHSLYIVQIRPLNIRES